MKIGQPIATSLTNTRNELKAPSTNANGFQNLVVKQEQKLHFNQLQTLYRDVDAQAERLLKSQTLKDLHRFKQMVKRFVKESVDFGMDLKQSHSWTPEGYSQMLTTVNKVDELLCEMTDELLVSGKDSLDLLAKVGEVKGMLINLFA
ncbi:MAG: YaaR family protein [Bacilli bacterium]